ncbi:TRAP transporter small permease [Planococcus sp. X10-3]|uniref:TRAP transporter small permease n=1 Tax=Planococcus sp. X10-3 TaxID=3061240 RepID=UPI003BAE5FE4
MRKKLDFITVLEFIAFILVVSLVFIMFVQVFSRKFLDTIPVWSGEEVATLLLIWLVNVGAGIAAGRNTHIAMDYVVEKLPENLRRATEIFVYAVICVFLAVIAWVSFQLAWEGRNAFTARLNISMFWIQISIFSGLAIMFYYYAKLLIDSIGKRKDKRIVAENEN